MCNLLPTIFSQACAMCQFLVCVLLLLLLLLLLFVVVCCCLLLFVVVCCCFVVTTLENNQIQQKKQQLGVYSQCKISDETVYYAKHRDLCQTSRTPCSISLPFNNCRNNSSNNNNINTARVGCKITQHVGLRQGQMRLVGGTEPWVRAV